MHWAVLNGEEVRKNTNFPIQAQEMSQWSQPDTTMTRKQFLLSLLALFPASWGLSKAATKTEPDQITFKLDRALTEADDDKELVFGEDPVPALPHDPVFVLGDDGELYASMPDGTWCRKWGEYWLKMESVPTVLYK